MTAWIASVIIFVGQLPAIANSTPFTRIIVFGDSLSDTGNFYELTGHAYPPSPPYWLGHFCNGPVWVEYLAADLGMAGFEDDYAIGGATTGHDNFAVPPFGGVQDQIAQYLTSSPQADPNALYILWAGHNDIFGALATGNYDISPSLINTVNNITILWAAGARHILVPNLADLGKTPFLGSTPASAAAVSGFVAIYNQNLSLVLDGLSAAGVKTISVDAFGFMDTVVANLGQFGFSNGTDEGLLALDPAGYLFWDDVHPTTEFQHAFEQFVLRGLVAHFSPSRGKGTPTEQVNALNGLVPAGKGQ